MEVLLNRRAQYVVGPRARARHTVGRRGFGDVLDRQGVITSVLQSWQALNRATSNGATLTRDSGGLGGWGPGASSAESFAGDFFVEFLAGPGSKCIGLSGQSGSHTQEGIDYGFLRQPNGLLWVVENGAMKWGSTWQISSDGALCRIARHAGVVYYFVNGQLVYTSAKPSNGSVVVNVALYGDSVSTESPTVLLPSITTNIVTGKPNMVTVTAPLPTGSTITTTPPATTGTTGSTAAAGTGIGATLSDLWTNHKLLLIGGAALAYYMFEG